MGSAEKQKIIMQISAVQTDIKRNIEERSELFFVCLNTNGHILLVREVKLKEMTVVKLDEMEKKMVELEKSLVQTERDLKTFLTGEMEKQSLHIDSSSDSVRKLGEADGEKVRGRLAQFSDDLQNMDTVIAEMKSNITADLQKIMQEADSREKVLDAKIDDQGDKLRLGMLSLQSAIGEGRQGEGGPDDDGDFVPLDEVEKLQSEAMEGLRETFTKQITDIEAEIVELKSNIQQQGDVIEARLRSHQKDGEDASNILGDKLHQKMDSIVFTQERIKRQIEELQDRGAGAPTDIADLQDRIEDIERSAAKAQSAGASANQSDVEAMRKDLNKILGRDEAGTAEVDGIPTLVQFSIFRDKFYSFWWMDTVDCTTSFGYGATT